LPKVSIAIVAPHYTDPTCSKPMQIVRKPDIRLSTVILQDERVA